MDTSFDIIRQYRWLKENAFYPFENSEKYEFKKNEILEMKEKLKILVGKLNKVTQEEIEVCQKNLFMSTEKVLELISIQNLNYPLSRNQGLVIDNYVYGKILGVLSSAMNSCTGFGYPQFYFEKDGDFDSKAIKALLKELSDSLKKEKFINYLQFEEFFESFRERILEMWKHENERKKA